MMRAFRSAGIIFAGLLIVGCAPVGTGVVTIDDVAAERAEISQARVDRLLQSYGDYLQSRWPGLALPSPRIEQWTEIGQWPAVFEACANEESGLTVVTDPAAGVYAVPGPRNDAELLALETSIYVCQGRFPPPSLARNEPGPVERAWITDYETVQRPACVRRLGFDVQPLSGFEGRSRADEPLSYENAYSSVRRDAAELVRVQRVCPPASTVLGTLTAAGDTE